MRLFYRLRNLFSFWFLLCWLAGSALLCWQHKAWPTWYSPLVLGAVTLFLTVVYDLWQDFKQNPFLPVLAKERDDE